MSRVYDLHSHSNQSDGILSPEALVSRAKCQNVAVLALTDHDTTRGVAAARRQAQLEDLELITGVEFSCQWRNHTIHIVGLSIDIDHAAIVELEAAQTERRTRRAQLIGDKLAHLGFADAYQGATALADGAVVGRPHFAEFLVQAGHCSTVAQAFKRYLGMGKPGDIKQIWPDIAVVVEAIIAAGGVAVLAHPHKYKMTRTKLCAMVERFTECGGGALEVISGAQTPNITADLARIAAKYQLLASCGSDFHAPGRRWQELGCAPVLPAELSPVWQHWEA